jgi:hypothetical protein
MARVCPVSPTSFSGSLPLPRSPSTLLILSPLIDPGPFNSFCAEYDRDPVKDAYDLETLKEFVQEVGYGMDGVEGDDDPPDEENVEQVPPSEESDKRVLPSLGSVQQVWRDFTAEFRRHHDPIPRNTTGSVTNVRSPSYSPSNSQKRC